MRSRVADLFFACKARGFHHPEGDTNRQSRWNLDRKHPDYTAADQIPLIEAKLLANTLEFEDAPEAPEEVLKAATTVIGHAVNPGSYRCPVSGRAMNFQELSDEAENPTHGELSAGLRKVEESLSKGGER